MGRSFAKTTFLSAGNITHTPAYGNLIALGVLTALQAHQAPVVVGCEQVRLVPGGGKQVEQHDANTERLICGIRGQSCSRRASRKPVSQVS